MMHDIARERFALANGWKFTRTDFTLDALIKGLYSGGRNDSFLIRPEYGNPFQHRESFRAMPPVGRYGGVKFGLPVAIMAHNDDDSANTLRRLIDDLNGELVLHVPEAGKAVCWYSPGKTLPMCVTRPSVKVMWPTADEIAYMAAAFQQATKG